MRFLLLLLVMCVNVVTAQEPAASWKTLQTTGKPTARHEAAFVGYGQKIYLIGGRRINPVDVFDPQTRTWTENAHMPIELHHFQGVVDGNAMYLMGAMTGWGLAIRRRGRGGRCRL